MTQDFLEVLKVYNEHGWSFQFTYDGNWEASAYHESFKKSNYIALPQADGATPEEAFYNMMSKK